jgi:hypothetical protein
MDIEHFGFLSSVIRKTESHEQDGETLCAALALKKTASGDPAMALHSSSRLARMDLSVRLYSAAVLKTCRPHNGELIGVRPQRARMKTARETFYRRMPSLSINVL